MMDRWTVAVIAVLGLLAVSWPLLHYVGKRHVEPARSLKANSSGKYVVAVGSAAVEPSLALPTKISEGVGNIGLGFQVLPNPQTYFTGGICIPECQFRDDDQMPHKDELQ